MHINKTVFQCLYTDGKYQLQNINHILEWKQASGLVDESLQIIPFLSNHFYYLTVRLKNMMEQVKLL